MQWRSGHKLPSGRGGGGGGGGGGGKTLNISGILNASFHYADYILWYTSHSLQRCNNAIDQCKCVGAVHVDTLKIPT